MNEHILTINPHAMPNNKSLSKKNKTYTKVTKVFTQQTEAKGINMCISLYLLSSSVTILSVSSALMVIFFFCVSHILIRRGLAVTSRDTATVFQNVAF